MILVWPCLAVAVAHLAAKEPQRPNLIVILTDDLGWSDIGCYGSEIPTPNIDALAAGGMKFRAFYNGAQCRPSRASLISGLYPHDKEGALLMQSRGDSAGNSEPMCLMPRDEAYEIESELELTGDARAGLMLSPRPSFTSESN